MSIGRRISSVLRHLLVASREVFYMCCSRGGLDPRLGSALRACGLKPNRNGQFQKVSGLLKDIHEELVGSFTDRKRG